MRKIIEIVFGVLFTVLIATIIYMDTKVCEKAEDAEYYKSALTTEREMAKQTKMWFYGVLIMEHINISKYGDSTKIVGQYLQNIKRNGNQ